MGNNDKNQNKQQGTVEKTKQIVFDSEKRQQLLETWNVVILLEVLYDSVFEYIVNLEEFFKRDEIKKYILKDFTSTYFGFLTKENFYKKYKTNETNYFKIPKNKVLFDGINNDDFAIFPYIIPIAEVGKGDNNVKALLNFIKMYNKIFNFNNSYINKISFPVRAKPVFGKSYGFYVILDKGNGEKDYQSSFKNTINYLFERGTLIPSMPFSIENNDQIYLTDKDVGTQKTEKNLSMYTNFKDFFENIKKMLIGGKYFYYNEGKSSDENLKFYKSVSAFFFVLGIQYVMRNFGEESIYNIIGEEFVNELGGIEGFKKIIKDGMLQTYVLKHMFNNIKNTTNYKGTEYDIANYLLIDLINPVENNEENSKEDGQIKGSENGIIEDEIEVDK